VSLRAAPLPPPAPAPVAPPPPPEKPREPAGTRLWLGLGALLGPGIEHGPVSFGGTLRGGYRLPTMPVFVAASGSYASAGVGPNGLEATWTTASIGAGAVFGISRVAIRPRLDVVLAELVAEAADPRPRGSSGSRRLLGAGAGVELGWPSTDLFSVVLGAEGSFLSGGTTIRLGPSRVESLLLRGPGLIAGILLYPLALKLYANGIAYVFCDFGTGACCFLAIVGIAGLISRVSALGKVIGLVGIYSYGLYLIHQPYVIWLGLKIRPQSIAMFILIFVITAAILSVWGIVLEKTTNTLVNKIIPTRKRVPAPIL